MLQQRAFRTMHGARAALDSQPSRHRDAAVNVTTMPLVTAVVLPAIMAAVLGGCSRRPTEWNSGLERLERPNHRTGAGGRDAAGQRPGAGNGSGGASGEGAGDGSGGTGGGGTSGTGGGKGPAEGAGASASNDAESSGGSSPGGPSSEGQPVAGSTAGSAAGAAAEASAPPAALPGKPSAKPSYDAATAAQVGERELRRAETRRSRGDLSTAYDAALEAFEAVEPHAAADEACRGLLARAKRLLADLAAKLNRQNQPRDQPTFFE
jgi:hypothetical protein